MSTATVATQTEVKTRPILFSAPMVKAILENRKTQTRRAMKTKVQPEPARFTPYDSKHLFHMPTSNSGKVGIFEPSEIKCPYGAVGDRLWVRESFWVPAVESIQSTQFVIYDAEHAAEEREVSRDRDGIMQTGSYIGQYAKKPSIHLPRWASRITLEITNVRVERLNEINCDDALAEGVTQEMFTDAGISTPESMEEFLAGDYLKRGYRLLWESINGPSSWAADPWVWAISFKSIENEAITTSCSAS